MKITWDRLSLLTWKKLRKLKNCILSDDLQNFILTETTTATTIMKIVHQPQHFDFRELEFAFDSDERCISKGDLRLFLIFEKLGNG